MDEEEDEFIVLACDGIWDVMSSQDCVDLIREKIATTPLTEIAEQVLDRCISHDIKATQGKGGDNMTIVIVRFSHALA